MATTTTTTTTTMTTTTRERAPTPAKGGRQEGGSGRAERSVNFKV
jgi:hypothetical protein